MRGGEEQLGAAPRMREACFDLGEDNPVEA